MVGELDGPDGAEAGRREKKCDGVRVAFGRAAAETDHHGGEDDHHDERRDAREAKVGVLDSLDAARRRASPGRSDPYRSRMRPLTEGVKDHLVPR